MNLFVILIGMAFGFLIVASGLSSYTVIHDMLLLRGPDVFLLMGSSFAVAMPLLWILRRRKWKTPMAGELSLNQVPNERKHVFGGAIFGAGWATAGTCPGPASGMTASGGLLGLVVMAGLGSGIILRNLVAGNIFSRRDPPLDQAQPATNS
jgi:uncharacterized membrane protein YedE/YeeE